MKTQTLFFCLFVFFTKFNVLSQDHLRQKSAEELADFVADTEFGLGDCMYSVDAIVNSAPDAAVLFESKGRFEYMKHGPMVWKYVSWAPSFMQGDGEPEGGESAWFCRENRWGLLTKNDESYALIVNRNKPTTRNLRKETLSRQSSRPIFVPLFDWPLHVDSVFFHEWPYDSLAKAIFSDSKQCRSVEQNKDGTLKSAWVVAAAASKSAKYVTTKNGVPVRYEVVVYDQKFDPSKGIPERKHGSVRYDVRTSWKEFDTIKVPSHVESIMRSPDGTVLSLSADISVVGTENDSFKTAVIAFEKMISEAVTPRK